MQESESSVPSVQALIKRCQLTWKRVRKTLCKSRESICRAANRQRSKAPRYICGQRVWLSTRNLPLRSPSRKLAPKFIGPFSIIKVLSPMAVRLRLPSYLQRVHPVFHVSCIKPVIRPPSRPSPSPPPPPPPFWSRVHRCIGSRNCWPPALGEGVFSTWSIGRGTARRREAGSLLGTFWTARSSRTSFALASLLPRERQEALLGGGVLSCVGFDSSFLFFSISRFAS